MVAKRLLSPAGGETIREINRQSGAHVELDRNAPPNMGEKIFTIRGTPQQIQHAIQLICEKTGMQVNYSVIVFVSGRNFPPLGLWPLFVYIITGWHVLYYNQSRSLRLKHKGKNTGTC